MASRFAHLRQRDNSVSMLRVKNSRRRSQSQKENRERVVNTRRQLGTLKELEITALDDSIAVANMSIIQEGKKNNTLLPKAVAGEERLKQLQRWKERKALEKEKEQREKARKGVFKTGLYHPKDALNIDPLPPVPAAPGRAKEVSFSCHSQCTQQVLTCTDSFDLTKTQAAPVRVTRSMKQQQVQKPLKMQTVNSTRKKSPPPIQRATRSRNASSKPKVESATHGLSTRSANKPPVTAAPVMKDKCAGMRTTRSKVVEVAQSPSEENNCDVKIPVQAVPGESIYKPAIEQEPKLSDKETAVDQTVPGPASVDLLKSLPKASSFAPKGFLFQAPDGLSSFKFEPLTPRSADAFLTPSSSFTLPAAPAFEEAISEKSETSPKSPLSVQEPMHDVPYFRSEIVTETDKLTGLCSHWESKVEDESLPEEMRDRMRTAIGQARLLMKERFKQFSGLVDDCDFGRGEKITTCSDLQGFWDMVYFQVEDVIQKFDALKEAEARGWVDEHKPLPRQRKVVKKPAAAEAPTKPAGTKAAAKSRLAAAKAAMKARQQTADSEKAESTEQSTQETQEAKSTDTVVFNAAFFKVKTPGSVRRSRRLSAAVLPQPSPLLNCLTPPRVTRRSLALAQTPVQTCTTPQPMSTPSFTHNKTPALEEQSLLVMPQPQSTVSGSLCFSPVKEVSSDPTEQPENMVSDFKHSDPSSAVEEQECLAEDLNVDLVQSSHLSQSPCQSPMECAAPVPSASLSFSLSPCSAQLFSPAVSCTPHALLNLLKNQDSLAATPDISVTEDMGVDFERYLQPSQRNSLSPKQPVSMESSMVMDVDMESPRGHPEDLLTQQNAVSTSPLTVPTLNSQSPQTVQSALLLFTPDLQDRIRQSVCPSDLMVFTPPHL
ncbi:disks large-associated protein 5 [Eucyclogobius newberryi]|uniref:disks large-associated protein 5 n=1 Tax=Eucyclogobius newberryi TaxID=166745 RepID=UPI003B5A8BD6